MEKRIKLFFISFLISVILLSSGGSSSVQNEKPLTQIYLSPAMVMAAGTSQATQQPPQTQATIPAKFRVDPIIGLRPVSDIIDTEQDGIVELYMNNPSSNDVLLQVKVLVYSPAGIHVHGKGFMDTSSGAEYSEYEVPPGTERTTTILMKADIAALIGVHTVLFRILYFPDDNVADYKMINLTYSVNVKAASMDPDSPEPSKPRETPGFTSILAIVGILTITCLLTKK